MQDEIEIPISTFDDELIMENGTKKVSLSTDQISDIISHAIQLTIINRFDDMNMSKDRVSDELHEAIFSAGLLDSYKHILYNF